MPLKIFLSFHFPLSCRPAISFDFATETIKRVNSCMQNRFIIQTGLIPKCILLLLLATGKMTIPCQAQANYEIQVYGSETVAPGHTMLELHSNYTSDGSTRTENGVLPTNHVFHETVEITHGFTSWFEIGLYFFNTIGSNRRTNYVGSHIRPRIALPAKYHWPVGLSLSLEGGYQKKEYDEDDWSMEIRPIIDKTLGKLYLSLNP